MGGIVGAVLAGLVVTACGPVGAWPAAAPADDPVATVTPTPTPRPTPQGTLDWEPCGERLECAALPVPLDHAQPDGPTIDIAVVRLPAPPAADRIGAVVVNPGGPGVSGVDLVRDAATEVFPAEVRTRFDIVGFDPRGVGASGAIECATRSEDLLALDLAPATPEAWAGLADAFADFGRGCAERSGALLEHVSTADVVADLDLLRAALGEPALTYVGFSYGTRIGALYAQRHPDKVRAMVLDGAVDPSLSAAEAAHDQAVALEQTFEQFLAECAGDPGCPLAAGGDPAEQYERVRAAVQAGTLAAPSLAPDRRVSATELHVTVAGLLRDREHGWPWLAEALAAAGGGDGSLLAALASGEDHGGESDAEEPHDTLAALWAVNCTDLPAPAAADFPALGAQIAAAAPRLGTATLALELPCAVWPVRAAAAPAPVSAAGAPPLVVIGVTGDPVTPFAWSESLAGQLDARLLTRHGARHTAFGGGNVCTDRAVSTYLVKLVRPPAGWSCG